MYTVNSKIKRIKNYKAYGVKGLWIMRLDNLKMKVYLDFTFCKSDKYMYCPGASVNAEYYFFVIAPRSTTFKAVSVSHLPVSKQTTDTELILQHIAIFGTVSLCANKWARPHLKTMVSTNSSFRKHVYLIYTCIRKSGI